MGEFQPLIDQLYLERVERARKMTPEERMDKVFELSEFWFENPDADLLERQRLVREMEDRMYYGPPQPRL